MMVGRRYFLPLFAAFLFGAVLSLAPLGCSGNADSDPSGTQPSKPEKGKSAKPPPPDPG